ncbi:MAG: helix-turn-helix domain-containing protein [Bacteroidia bacterium]|nr:helix-turn-helix domain-containing protein [Bacteroidia bacterium]
MKKAVLLPKERKIIAQLGENIRLARLRRKISAELLAERANIGRTTLWSLEKGDANVSLVTLVRVLHSLGMADELGRIALDDALGRKLQDIELMRKNVRTSEDVS